MLVAALALLAFVFFVVASPFREWRCPWLAALLAAKPLA